MRWHGDAMRCQCDGDGAALRWRWRIGIGDAMRYYDAILRDDLRFSFRRLNIDRTVSMQSRPPGANTCRTNLQWATRRGAAYSTRQDRILSLLQCKIGRNTRMGKPDTHVVYKSKGSSRKPVMRIAYKLRLVGLVSTKPHTKK